MGKITITKWQCDRCGCIADERPSSPGETFTVEVFHELEWAGGKLIQWKEMCRECNVEVADDAAYLRDRARAATHRAALGDRPHD